MENQLYTQILSVQATAFSVLQRLRRRRPATKRELSDYLKVFLKLSVPDKNICPGHCSPMDYLWHAFAGDFEKTRKGGDCIVWACRGGGKTKLAAAATLLDSIFKGGCQTRILAGSMEQAGRMYKYLRQFIAGGFDSFLTEPIRKNRCVFSNGSDVEVLAQSDKSVRGRHIHKLRCDEAELLDADVFAAAQFVTRSDDCARSAMELLSTVHRPWGLMQKQIALAEKNDTPVFRWCLWEVIEKCPRERSCSRCPLNSDCQGKARNAAGYLHIDDVIAQMRRASRAGFAGEMLCLGASLENAVFAEFDPAVHVAKVFYDPNLPLYRAIDFGFVNPFVCLWIQTADDGSVRIIDEYIRTRATVAEHAGQILSRTLCVESALAGTFCDPAGAGRNDVTGTSAVRELSAMGIKCRYRPSAILAGVELIRAALAAGDGKSRLVIDPKCSHLIRALTCYHYPDSGGELPEKDGVYDHPVDALRYFFINRTGRGKTIYRRY